MQEIEVKAKLVHKSLVIQKLSELGVVLPPPIKQYDRIFIPRGATLPTTSGECALRIREQENKFFFTVKQTQSNDLDCLEKEMEIDSTQAEILLESFPLMGFREIHSVRKIRQKGKYTEYEICLDTVEDLGEFIEVERLTAENTSKSKSAQIQAELFSFLENLGVKTQDQVFHGYDILLMQKDK